MSDDPYVSAFKKCDIVMKGGVTSGIVYPRAVAQLAREYRLQSIGGTSAGAIAAAVTAAAEYRRRKGQIVFEELYQTPSWLGKPCQEKSVVWFSDGGICSNFPLHLFDSPLPRWPTFGLNLRETRADYSYDTKQDQCGCRPAISAASPRSGSAGRADPPRQ